MACHKLLAMHLNDDHNETGLRIADLDKAKKHEALSALYCLVFQK